ncbi:hypothetical protein EV368DRAFT_73399 [Lentinula lateritia]|uniref:Uncharacterized protein n=1 Tax=Lentinula aff. lateritia TaxID=2804960 RepID=A0ACC1TGZ1_9AGAR|nr:hypothetical protein F5876DRAFT_84247 [Lentinula aff. lateritia]KAJ3853549.1 hypothetical protein EV368DRAFT_73399 [Lentinula lateritia]
MTGYISSPWTVRPFDEPEIGAAIVHIRVEHAFGKLKGRFPSLKEMGHHADVQEMYKVIKVLLILHNICIDFGDAPESIFDFDPKDDFPLQDLTTVNLGYIAVDGDAAIPPYETDQWIREAGHRKRKLIFNNLFPPL